MDTTPQRQLRPALVGRRTVPLTALPQVRQRPSDQLERMPEVPFRDAQNPKQLVSAAASKRRHDASMATATGAQIGAYRAPMRPHAPYVPRPRNKTQTPCGSGPVGRHQQICASCPGSCPDGADRQRHLTRLTWCPPAEAAARTYVEIRGYVRDPGWRRWDSNPRLLRCDRSALPAELRPRMGHVRITDRR